MFDVFKRGQKIVGIKTEINKEKCIYYARSINTAPATESFGRHTRQDGEEERDRGLHD